MKAAQKKYKGRIFFITKLVLFFLFFHFFKVYTQDRETEATSLYKDASLTEERICEKKKEFICQLDYLYKGMPKEDLTFFGYSSQEMFDYYTYEDLEFMVFSDWTTVSFKNIITFVIKDGKVTDWFKGHKEDILEYIQQIR